MDLSYQDVSQLASGLERDPLLSRVYDLDAVFPAPHYASLREHNGAMVRALPDWRNGKGCIMLHGAG